MADDLLKINIKFDKSFDILPTNLVESLALEYGNEYSNLALEAYKAKVPVRTEELRNSLRRDVSSVSTKGAKAKIYVPSGVHSNSPFPTITHRRTKGGKPTLAALAEELNQVSYKRSKDSNTSFTRFSGIGAGESTQDWEEKAFNDFEASI